MEGSAAYARSYLKSDLRNTRTLLGVLGRVADAGLLRQLEELVHDVTVGLREQCPPTLDVDALRRFVEVEAAEAVRGQHIAEDTLRQWVRSLERVLPWWGALPSAETLLDEARWTEPASDTLAIRITADERFRVIGLPRTRDAVRARFEKYLAKHPGVDRLVLIDDEHGDAVFSLVAEPGGVRLAS